MKVTSIETADPTSAGNDQIDVAISVDVRCRDAHRRTDGVEVGASITHAENASPVVEKQNAGGGREAVGCTTARTDDGI